MPRNSGGIEQKTTSELRTVVEVATQLSVSRSHVYNLMDAGELAYVKLGASRRIPQNAVDELVHRNLVTSGK